ncbi:ultraviolet-B receptor UVR8 [Acrasis kona]|uniref:Ultraviolet-B receptor UVR8 n=1 Tax=Acrasis kona TaxID=1008807 RepID=A0AAW2Z860_9EUKA
MNLLTPRNRISVEPYDEAYSWGWNNMQLGHHVESISEENKFKAPLSPTKRVGSILNENVLEPSLIDLSGLGSKIAMVATGGSHTVIVTVDKKVYTFGRNQSGQLGHGGFSDEASPKLLEFEEFSNDPVISVACGDRHTVFVTEGSRVFVCGQNFNGQLGVGHKSNLDRPTNSELMERRRITRAVCGSRHTILISSKGEIGWGAYGQLGLGDNLDQLYSKKIDVDWKVANVVSKEHINLALTTEYEIYQWGGKPFENEELQVNNKPRLVIRTLNDRRVVEIAVASNHCLARTSDGCLYSWGFKFEGLGYIKYLKHLEYTDENENRKMSSGEELISKKRLDMSDKSIIRDNSECTVYRNHFFNNEKVSSIACGDKVNFVVTESGKLFVFGRGENGELGLGKDEEADVPTQVKGTIQGKFVVKVIGGYWHAIALIGSNEHFRQQLDYLPHLQNK